MRTYTQLTQGQRYQIYALLKMGHRRAEIAGVIGVHKATVSRELKRNHGRLRQPPSAQPIHYLIAAGRK